MRGAGTRAIPPAPVAAHCSVNFAISFRVHNGKAHILNHRYELQSQYCINALLFGLNVRTISERAVQSVVQTTRPP